MKRKNSTNDDDRGKRSSYNNDIDNNVGTKKNKTNKHKDMRLCLHCLADVDYNANGTYHSTHCRKYNVARQDVFKLVKGDDMIACNCNNKPVKYCNYIKQQNYCCEIPALLTLIRSTKFKDRKSGALCYTDFFQIVQQIRRQYHSKVTLVPKNDSNVDRSTTPTSSIGSKETPMNGPYDTNERKTASLNGLFHFFIYYYYYQLLLSTIRSSRCYIVLGNDCTINVSVLLHCQLTFLYTIVIKPISIKHKYHK